jgi:hypothetical protein
LPESFLSNPPLEDPDGRSLRSPEDLRNDPSSLGLPNDLLPSDESSSLFPRKGLPESFLSKPLVGLDERSPRSLDDEDEDLRKDPSPRGLPNDGLPDELLLSEESSSLLERNGLAESFLSKPLEEGLDERSPRSLDEDLRNDPSSLGLPNDLPDGLEEKLFPLDSDESSEDFPPLLKNFFPGLEKDEPPERLFLSSKPSSDLLRNDGLPDESFLSDFLYPLGDESLLLLNGFPAGRAELLRPRDLPDDDELLLRLGI